MKILFTSPVLEHPAAGGSQLRVENSIKALAQVCEMDIISRSPPSVAGGTVAENFYRQFCTEFHVMPGVMHLSANKYVRKIQRILSNIGGRNLRREAEYLIRHADRRGMQVIWFGYGNISFPLIRRIKQLRPDLKLVCDTDSIWSRFVLRGAPYAKGIRKAYILWSGKQKEREEAAWVNLCDVTTAVSEVDAEYYRSLAQDKSKVRIFSNVIDVETYRNPPPPPPVFHRPSIYLAGTFGHYHSPMDTAARWMLEDVLPILRKQVPGIHFYLVGKRSDEMFGHLNDPQVTVTGMLPSVLPYLCHVDVALVPLKFESGTRYKILEAGACKVPLVSTTLGAEGLPAEHEKHLLLADDPQAFADAIVRLLNDRAYAAGLAQNCHDLVCRQYSVETLVKEAQSILGYLQS